MREISNSIVLKRKEYEQIQRGIAAVRLLINNTGGVKVGEFVLPWQELQEGGNWEWLLEFNNMEILLDEIEEELDDE